MAVLIASGLGFEKWSDSDPDLVFFSNVGFGSGFVLEFGSESGFSE